jgi:mevalonate kinase
MRNYHPLTEQSFHANGKLLLSGEYLVLHGALALAIPLIKGQNLMVKPGIYQGLTWKAFKPDGEWFSAKFDKHLSLVNSNNTELAERLKNILESALKQKNATPSFLHHTEVTTHIEFNPEWGWGTSSTLISNLAQWLKIDPWKLLAETWGGSGYDIACARANSPILYQIKNEHPKISSVDFAPTFENQLWLIYQNRKQNSGMAIRNHQKNLKQKTRYIQRVSDISKDMGAPKTPREFEMLMTEHESLISSFTGLPTVKEKLFPDFHGAVKSLGAWGGDFVLALSHLSDKDTKTYFQTKGYNILFKLSTLKLDANNAR